MTYITPKKLPNNKKKDFLIYSRWTKFVINGPVIHEIVVWFLLEKQILPNFVKNDIPVFYCIFCVKI